MVYSRPFKPVDNGPGCRRAGAPFVPSMFLNRAGRHVEVETQNIMYLLYVAIRYQESSGAVSVKEIL